MEVLEIIEDSGTIVYTDANAAQAHLESLPISVRLDFHGVLDTIPSIQPLPCKVCVISYVGRISPLRAEARRQIQERILAGQILFGVLVFTKGYTRREKRTFVSPGSKAWVNAHLPSISGQLTCFIDDHIEHVRSTQYICPTIYCIHFTGPNLLETLECSIAASRQREYIST